ncbi:MAG: branched-chain amino acid transport system II carrier protein [Flavobacteriaceae bacterium]|nr:branched-chain amino acid transport system II carrier protein [Flavobacteriaceae bacterium]
MSANKKLLITSFALFSLFFGAGNLILPPYLGFISGERWIWITIGFAMTAVVVPIFGIIAHSKVQGTLFDLGKKVSPLFSLLYCILIYFIALALPSPRTASVTHEIAISPFFGTSPLLTSAIYFGLVLLFTLKRSSILDIIGKYLTPLIILLLLLIIFNSLFSTHLLGEALEDTNIFEVLAGGVLEGYQTFDAIGAVVVGAVIIVSINLKGETSFEEKRKLIAKSGIIAGCGLLFIYAGLIYSGFIFQSHFEQDISRTELLTSISKSTLGSMGNSVLSVLVGLACFTTAVGIVTGSADYFRSLFKDSQTAYVATAIIGCLLGVVMGSYNVDFIINLAIPTLMFIYPLTIVLIFLNVTPSSFTTPFVFRAVVLTAFVFSIPDFMQSFIASDYLAPLTLYIPLADKGLGWLIPSFIVFMVTYSMERRRIKRHS